MYIHKYLRSICLVIADMLIISVGFYFAFWLRLDVLDTPFSKYPNLFWDCLPWLLGIRLLCGFVARQYTWAFHQIGINNVFSTCLSLLSGSALFVLLTAVLHVTANRPPRTVYFLEFALSFLGMAFIRYFPEFLTYCKSYSKVRFMLTTDKRTKTLILGAGHTGHLLLRDILHTEDYPYHVVGFIDDSMSKAGLRIMGVPVLGRVDDLPDILERYGVSKILIAVAKMSSERLREIIESCKGKHVRFKKIPSYKDIVINGKHPVVLSDLKLEDLLRRNEIVFDHSMLAEYFVGKTVLVTGAAGSIGSEICRQVAEVGIKKLVALDLDENNLYFLRMDIHEQFPDLDFKFAFGSVRKTSRLEQIFREHRPDIVFHAAAHKHVPLMEECPCEALENNVLGTINVAECASKFDVERFVLISTDKAVRPTNIMGASKYLAEVALRKIQKESRTHFMAVRFGNVLGSSGSLVPILQRQIKNGGPVTITHPKITRYFMTIPEAVGLVLIASVQNEGGTCVLDMGEPVLIEEVARHLIALNGLVPDVDIAIQYVGLRPGEKMYEELFLEEEKLSPSSHSRIRLAHPLEHPAEFEQIKRQITEITSSQNTAAAIDFIKENVFGYAIQCSQTATDTASMHESAVKA